MQNLEEEGWGVILSHIKIYEKKTMEDHLYSYEV